MTDAREIAERLRKKVFRGPTMEAVHTKTVEWMAAAIIDQQAAEIERLRAGLDAARHQLAWAARKLKDAGVSDGGTNLSAGNAASLLEETRT